MRDTIGIYAYFSFPKKFYLRFLPRDCTLHLSYYLLIYAIYTGFLLPETVFISPCFSMVVGNGEDPFHGIKQYCY